jgi:hypothetical protein
LADECFCHDGQWLIDIRKEDGRDESTNLLNFSRETNEDGDESETYRGEVYEVRGPALEAEDGVKCITFTWRPHSRGKL